jgi:cyanophycinase-like exopeptidase
MGRLLVFLARIKKESKCQTVRGIGIDERAAVTLDLSGHAQVMGDGAAYLVQLSATPKLEPNTPATIPAMPVTAIPTGQSFKMDKWPAPAYQLSVTNGAVKSTKDSQYAIP